MIPIFGPLSIDLLEPPTAPEAAVDPFHLANNVVHEVSMAGVRARIEAKRGPLGETSELRRRERLAAIVQEAQRGQLSEEVYKSHLDRASWESGMIQRLRLRNWRSYEELDLQLDPGTTFVVAPNGVGKTSLVYGLAWGVFGQHSSVDPKSSIRAGAACAEVRVEVGLPDGRRLSISRTAKRRGAPTATYEIGGAKLTQSSALAEMEKAFGIELQAAGRLSMMLGGGHIATSAALNLESHLHHAFGVHHLLRATQTASLLPKRPRRRERRSGRRPSNE